MKKQNKKEKQKSLLFYKIVLSTVFICTFMFFWFAGHVMADTNFKRYHDNTSVIIVMEPREYNYSDIIIEDEPIVLSRQIPSPKVKPEVEKLPIEQSLPADTLPLKPEDNISYIAIVIDDMGISQKRTKDILSIRAPITSAFLTYGKNLHELAHQAKNAGHEVIMHTPMEPEGTADLAPDTLKISMEDSEIRNAFLNMLAKFEGLNIKGINNHMGSLFTESAPKLDVVMNILKEKNMYFLDSKTSQYSQGSNVAEIEKVDYIARDIFLDNDNDYEKIKKQLLKAENIAKKTGFAVVIGHPKSNTFPALRDWLKTLNNKNIKPIHLSELIALKKASH